VHVFGRRVDRDDIAGACRRLLNRITFQMPERDRPAALRRMLEAGPPAEQHWIVRSLRSLIGVAPRAVPVDEPGKIDRLLGLDGRVLLLVVPFRLEGEDVPNCVWLARYPSSQAAQQAYRRYQGYLQSSHDADAYRTLIKAPKGPVLIGTWSAEQESVQMLLPRIYEQLP